MMMVALWCVSDSSAGKSLKKLRSKVRQPTRLDGCCYKHLHAPGSQLLFWLSGSLLCTQAQQVTDLKNKNRIRAACLL